MQEQHDILVHFLDGTQGESAPGRGTTQPGFVSAADTAPWSGTPTNLTHHEIIRESSVRIVAAPIVLSVPASERFRLAFKRLRIYDRCDMKHVLGMVKRHLDMNGAKGPKLELDFLRLVYAVKELRLSGNDAKGYLLVMTPSIAQRVAAWQSKYQAGESVVVEIAQLSQEQLGTIRAEVRANIDGMVAGTVGEDVAGRSDATAGAQIGEELLRQLIETRERGVCRSFNEREFPFGIRWDYYGTHELG